MPGTGFERVALSRSEIKFVDLLKVYHIFGHFVPKVYSSFSMKHSPWFSIFISSWVSFLEHAFLKCNFVISMVAYSYSVFQFTSHHHSLNN